MAIVSIGIYGNYLPWTKSVSFINAMRSLDSVNSLSGFETTISQPLDIPSPIGQEELVRNVASTIAGFLRQSNATNDLMKEAILYLNKYYQPVLDRHRGMSFEQDLFLNGLINETAFFKTKDPQYLVNSQKYYEEGFGLGPKRPQFLYGLLDIYQIEGQKDRAETMGEQIVSQWPDDGRTKLILSRLENATSSVQK